MACLDKKADIFIPWSEGAGVNVPAAYQVNIDDTADWLMVSIGASNLGGSAHPEQIFWRIYQGDYTQENNIVSGYLPVSQRPSAVGNGLTQFVVPWGRKLQFMVELYSQANIPAGSVVEMTISPFNYD